MRCITEVDFVAFDERATSTYSNIQFHIHNTCSCLFFFSSLLVLFVRFFIVGLQRTQKCCWNLSTKSNHFTESRLKRVFRADYSVIFIGFAVGFSPQKNCVIHMDLNTKKEARKKNCWPDRILRLLNQNNLWKNNI